MVLTLLQRRVGLNAASRLATQGWSANRIQGYLTGRGIGLRRATVQGIVRTVTGRMKGERIIQGLGGLDELKPGHMVETALGRPRRYRVFGNATYHDPTSDQTFTRQVSFYTDERALKVEYGDLFDAYVTKMGASAQLELAAFEMRSIEHNRGWAYD